MTSKRLARRPFIKRVGTGAGVPGWRVEVWWVGAVEPQLMTWQSRDEAFRYARGVVHKYCKPGHVDAGGADWAPIVRPRIVEEALAPKWRRDGWPA